MPRRVTITNVVHLPNTDDVIASGTVQNYVDPDGNPIVVSAHLWKSHLDQQPSATARRREIARALDEAVPRSVMATTLPTLTGDVDL